MLSGFEIVQIVAVYASVLGSICSALLLYLVLDIKVWNSFHKMIFWMTATQLMYDIFLPSFSFPLGQFWFLCLICLLSGVFSFLISTMLGFSVLYVLYYRAIFNFKKWRLPLSIMLVTPNIIMITIVLIGYYNKDSKMYSQGFNIANYVRLFCLFVNILFFLASKYMVNSLTGFSKGNSAALNNSIIAMKVLVGRLKYYALFQAISRVPAAFYEFTYGFNFGYYKINTLRFALVIICFHASMISPIAFLFIYLRLQPKAMEQLRNRFPCIFYSSWFKDPSQTKDSDSIASTEVRNPADTSKTIDSTRCSSVYSNDIEPSSEYRESQFSTNESASDTVNIDDKEPRVVNKPVKSISKVKKDNTPTEDSKLATLEKTIANLNDDELIALVGNESSINARLLSEY